VLIVFILALILTRTEFEVRVTPDRPPAGSKPLYVTVIGHQWWWEYIYDEYEGQALRMIAANDLHVPSSQGGQARPGLRSERGFRFRVNSTTDGDGSIEVVPGAPEFRFT
jgi:hypothetical protein